MKKSAWTDLDQRHFGKIVKVSDVEIGKLSNIETKTRLFQGT